MRHIAPVDGVVYVQRKIMAAWVCREFLVLAWVKCGIRRIWSFALCTLLSQGLVEALEIAGSAEQKQLFLPHLIDGSWTGTMNLTEAQSGTDLATIRTIAKRDGDTYRIFGNKIFITYGEHDLSENIIHLVLARTVDAPAGVKGISAFLVPKMNIDQGGNIIGRNDARCVRLENKLGIKGSPTAEMEYGAQDGAVGYLLGQENRGLEYMFIMMNRARFEVGMQGVSISERAFQQARSYANDRVQGKPLAVDNGFISGNGNNGSVPETIIGHPDVKKMLVEMKSNNCRNAVIFF